MTKDFVTERLKLKDLYPERAEALAKEHKIDVEDLELIKKDVVSEKVETVENERAVISFINMETVDRDNEIIDPDGAILKHYNKVVPYGHDYRGLPMGKSMWVKKDTKKGKRGLLAKTIFLKRPAINEELYHMFTDDVAGTGPALNSWSIGFIPLKWEELEKKGEQKEGEADTRPRRKYTKWELLEYSGVMIPSNREALTEMVVKGAIKSEKLKKDIIEIELEEMDNDYDNVIYNSGDLVTKPEETDDFIRIPVRDCKVTATITISAKQGITALYCGKIKKIRTYIFNKKPPYNWTMAKAKKWVEEHGKEIKIEAIKAYGKELTFVVEGDKTLEFIPPEEKAKYSCECVKCGWKHTSEKHCNTYKCEKCGGTMRRVERPGPGQESTDNQDSFDFLEDKREDIYSKEGVIELEDDNSTDQKGDVIGQSTDQKGVIPFRETSKAPEEEPKQTEREQQITRELFDRLTEQLNKVEEELKSLKEGRVLSSKNRKLVKQCADMLMVLYEATEPPQREEFELEVEEQKNPEPDPKLRNPIEIDRDSLTENIASIIKNRIGEMVQSAISKARGKIE